MLVTSIFSFSHNVFKLIKEKSRHLKYFNFVVCICSKILSFGKELLLHFVAEDSDDGDTDHHLKYYNFVVCICSKILSFGKALVFMCLLHKSFENTVRKREIACDRQFLLFS